MKKLILFTILLACNIKVLAYENDYFKINITDNYKISTQKKYNYKWINNNDYITIDITKNKNKNDIKKYTTKDILAHKKYLLNNYKKSLNDQIDIKNIEIIKNKNIYYIEYILTINTKKSTGYDTYQIGRIYASDNYIYTILMSSDKQISSKDILNSFEYKDSYPKELNIKEYMILISIILLSLLLLDYLITKKHQ